MKNIICNPKTKTSKTSNMNDKDYLVTMLEIEKNMVKNLATSLTEASNKDLYNDYFDMFTEIIDIERQIYDLIFKKGWCLFEMAKETKITKKLNMFEQLFYQLENEEKI